MKAKLTYVRNEDKISKAGKPYTRCSIKTEGTGDEWIDGFSNESTKSWQVGDEVELELYDDEYQGKVYKKFRTPKPSDVAIAAVDEVKRELALLKEGMMILTERINRLEKPPSKENFEDFISDEN